MLTLKKHIALNLIAALAFIPNAGAGLYGFTSANPYTPEEKILNIGVPPRNVPNFRAEMRDNIMMLSNFAALHNPDFQFIIHEDEELLSKSLWEFHLSGYNAARENSPNAKDPTFLYRLKNSFGQHGGVIGTPPPGYMTNLHGILLNNAYCGSRHINPKLLGSPFKVLSLDLCPDYKSYKIAVRNSVADKSLIQPSMDAGDLFSDIENQVIINENAENIFNIHQAQNFLFLNEEYNYPDKIAVIEKLRNTNFDTIIISPLFQDKTPYTKEDVDALKFKKNGTRRQVFAIMNLSEANPERYYWKKKWKIGNPKWLRRLSFTNKNTVITEYWNDEWRKILSNNFKSILDSGYDGVFLTGLENHKYFEQQLPLE